MTPSQHHRRYARMYAKLSALGARILRLRAGDGISQRLGRLSGLFGLLAAALLAIVLLTTAELPLLARSGERAEPAVRSVLQQADTSTPTPESQSTPRSHTVRPGETLSEIAKRYGFSVAQLLRINGIANANAIYVGQEIRLPQVERPVGVTVHVVESGDTLSGIARYYGVDLRTLMARNGIADADAIRTGQELIIPATEAEEAAAEQTEAPPAAPPTLVPPTPEPPTPVVVIVGAQAEGAATAQATQEPPTQEPPTPTATAQPAAGPLTHTVRPGETASGIAKRYGIPLRDLLRVNGIANADLLRSGAELVIPGAALDAAVATAEAQAVATSEPQAVAEAAESSAPLPVLPEIAHVVTGPLNLPDRPALSLNRTYTIVRGDTLGRIASRQGVDVDALALINGLPRDAALTAGDELLLPATDNELMVRTPANLYVVRPGDSLSRIAAANGVELGELMTANNIPNPDSLVVGQELLIPGQAVRGEAPLLRVGPAPSGYYYHVVQPGDTLSALADSLNSTKTALMDYNNLEDESMIYSGMELRVPYGAPQLPKRVPPVPISGNSFLVSLSRQQCWVLTGTEVRHAWNCSTGRADRRTKTGSFAVQSKIEMAESRVWRLDMPYWLGIYDVGRVENGIHGLPIDWDTGRKIWSQLIGQPATFGCAMLDDDDAATLWNLAYLGMPVTIVQ